MKAAFATRASRACFVVATMCGIGGVVAASACASIPDENRRTQVLLPDYTIYKEHVEPYLIRRCGSLDCHGQVGRPYRLYHQQGLRPADAGDGAEAGLASGQPAPGPPGFTTAYESMANFDSLVGLEPEEMSRVVAAQGLGLDKLVILRKPLQRERHKGGLAMGIDGFACISRWLSVPTVRGDGTPIPPQERVFGEDSANICESAANIR